MTKTSLAVIPCELGGKDGQFSPIILLGIDPVGKTCYVKYSQECLAFSVGLHDLRLAPEALETAYMDKNHSFLPRENIEVWLSWNKTCGIHNSANITPPSSQPTGSWWPGRVISIHDRFVHCEVYAPIISDASAQTNGQQAFYSNKCALQAIVVELSDIRIPWNGVEYEVSLNSKVELYDMKRTFISLENENVLHRYTMQFPNYLGEVCSLLDVQANLLRFCGAPCLMTFQNGRSDESSVFLTVTSASQEAIRRVSLLEIVHSSLLNERLKFVQTIRQMNGHHRGKKTSTAESLNGDTVHSDIGSRVFDDLSSRISCTSPIPISDCKISPLDTEPSNLGNSNSTISNPPPMHFTKLQSKVTDKSIFEGNFKIDPNLIGIIIGYSGSNISKARQIEGVQEISVNEDVVTILADSVEACESAREILDIIQVEIPILSEITPRLLGARGQNLKSLVDQSGVRKAFIIGPKNNRNGDKNACSPYERLELGVTLSTHRNSIRPSNGTEAELLNGSSPENGTNLESCIEVIGTRQAINKLKILLEYQFENWNELNELEGTRRTLQNELRKADFRSTNNVRPNRNRNNTNSSNAANEANENGHDQAPPPATTTTPAAASQPTRNQNRRTYRASMNHHQTNGNHKQDSDEPSLDTGHNGKGMNTKPLTNGRNNNTNRLNNRHPAKMTNQPNGHRDYPAGKGKIDMPQTKAAAAAVKA